MTTYNFISDVSHTPYHMQTKKNIIYRTHRYRLKTNSRITSYVEGLEAENRMWIELGVMARNLNVPFTAGSSPDPYPRSVLTCVTVESTLTHGQHIKGIAYMVRHQAPTFLIQSDHPPLQEEPVGHGHGF